MSFWSLYFITKTVLHHMGYLQVQLGWNVLLGLYVYWPIQSPRLRWLRLVVASIAAITLLWRESPLPPPAYVWQQAQLLSGFSMEYLLELLGRLVNYQVLLIVAAALLVYQLLARRVRFASFAWLGLLSVLLWPSASQQNNMAANAAATDSTEQPAQGDDRAATASNSLLERFFEVESAKQLSFDTSATKDFDVILVHVCSLAWDDLSFVNLSDHPFITNANVIFKQFNSAASYSGPALCACCTAAVASKSTVICTAAPMHAALCCLHWKRPVFKRMPCSTTTASLTTSPKSWKSAPGWAASWSCLPALAQPCAALTTA